MVTREYAPSPGESRADTALEVPNIAVVAGLIADPVRAQMLVALADGSQQSAGTLAKIAKISPSTASWHLKKLVDGAIVTVTPAANRRLYAIADPRIAFILEQLSYLAPQVQANSLSATKHANSVRLARMSYDHIAGRLGVELLAALRAQGHLRIGDPLVHKAIQAGATGRYLDCGLDYRLTESGIDFLKQAGVRDTSSGVEITVDRRLTYCLDWSQQAHHLAGWLGASLADHFLVRGWVKRGKKSPELLVTRSGLTELPAVFALDLSWYQPRSA